MHSRPTEGDPPPAVRRWKPCSYCDAQNPPWASHCGQCRQPFSDAREAAAEETAHVEYLMQQLPGWRQHGLLSDSAYLRLRSDYLHLQQQLTDILYTQSGSKLSATHSAVVSSDLPIASPAGNPIAPSATSDTPPLRPMDLSGIVPGRPAPVVSTSAPAPSVLGSASPHAEIGLRRFFQKHALQIVFALATVLVLAALRTMLGWAWIGDVAMRLLPVVPLGLTAMFWTFAQKTRAENPWAAFVYHGLAAAMSAFDVIALNKTWLPTPFTAKPALLLAALAAACVSGAMLRRWREIAYLHLFQIGVVTALFAILQMLRPQAPHGDFRLTPLWLFGGAFLFYAAFCLGMARRSESAMPKADTSVRGAFGSSWRMAWTLWAHFSVVGVVFLSAVHLALEHPSANEFALLSLLTGLIYMSGAQLLQDARMVRISCLFLLGSGLLWLDSHHLAQLWEGACAFLLALSALSLVLARYNRQQADRHGVGEKLAKAYLATGRWHIGFAAVLSCLYVAHAFGEVGAQNTRIHGIVGSALALACGGFYLALSRLKKKPALLYATFTLWAVGIASLLFASFAPHSLYPLVLTLYGVALAWSADRQSRRSEAAHTAEADWVVPQRKSGIGLTTLGALLAAGMPFQDTLAISWLWTAATLTFALLLYTGQARKSGEPVYAYAALGCAACISALLTWRSLLPQPFRVADSLAVFTLTTSMAGLALARRSGASDTQSVEKPITGLWQTCLTRASLVAALICLADGAYAFCVPLETSHSVYTLLPCLVASLLLCVSRYAQNRDVNDALRRSALACAGFAAGIEAGLLCHVRLSASVGWQPHPLQAWGISLVALGWGWRLAAHPARKWNEQEWWQRELTLASLTTALLGLLPLTLAAYRPQQGIALPLFEMAFVATFVLFAWEADRTRKVVPVVFSLVTVALAALANRAFAPDGVTGTLVVYGLAYVLLTLRCRETALVAATGWTLSAAYLHFLLSLTAGYAPSHTPPNALSRPHFAFFAVQASLLWLALGWQIHRRLDRADLARPLFRLATCLALASGFVALLTVQTPGEGKWSILTLGWAGAAWFLLWALEQGEICLHVATWNLILAWGLLLYDRVGANAVFLDLYLLPVGLHLLTTGHLQSRRQHQRQARSLWIAGLMLMITPAYLSFWNRAGDLHTLLFLGECLLAALWGIWRRIRAFILVSMGFVALYAASVMVGHLPDVWGTLVTLGVGVALFIAGFYILTHRARMQQWTAALEKQWQAWQAWR